MVKNNNYLLQYKKLIERRIRNFNEKIGSNGMYLEILLI